VRGGAVELRGLTKDYGPVTAVRGIDISIQPGEFFSLLGPSGCGKTSTLRMIAGFEEATAGTVLLDGQDVTHVPPNDRPVNTVFQNYALFPFMSVADNVAFGLKYVDVSKDEARRMVGEALERVRMSDYAKRKPSQLSGGQQQRVALARALVLGPKVLLLDEPLGALDAKLRKTLQVELKSLQESVGITFVYVTHDQEEALTMSDRIAVMAEGRVEQIGSPTEVYERPETAYVADFLGSANVLHVDVVEPSVGGRTSVRIGGAVVDAEGTGTPGEHGTLVIRPERVRLVSVGSGETVVATIERTIYLGAMSDVVVTMPTGETLSARIASEDAGGFQRGEPVGVLLRPEAMRIVPRGALPDHPVE
jgi:spermidine/putrescine transport system ATP-binding protein